VAKSTPFAVNYTSATLLQIVQAYFTPQDKKKDDVFLHKNDDETEPLAA